MRYLQAAERNPPVDLEQVKRVFSANNDAEGEVRCARNVETVVLRWRGDVATYLDLESWVQVEGGVVVLEPERTSAMGHLRVAWRVGDQPLEVLGSLFRLVEKGRLESGEVVDGDVEVDGDGDEDGDVDGGMEVEVDVITDAGVVGRKTREEGHTNEESEICNGLGKQG